MKSFQALGKIGKVTKVYDDGDLRVTVDGQTWTLNPLCLTPLPGSATELHNTMAASIRQEHISWSFQSPLLSFYIKFFFSSSSSNSTLQIRWLRCSLTCL